MSKALIIIDMQQEMQTRLDQGRDHVNGHADEVISHLAQKARLKGVPVIHIRHAEADETSPFRMGIPSAAPLPCDREEPGEAVFTKTTSSAFASTPLKQHLDAEGIDSLIVTGAVTGFCVTSTVRAASDLGYQVNLVEDGVLGFNLPEAKLTARQVHDVTIGLLAANFAKILSEKAALALLEK